MRVLNGEQVVKQLDKQQNTEGYTPIMNFNESFNIF